MAPRKTLSDKHARLANLAYHKPGSPEYEAARRDYYSDRSFEDLKASLAKSGPFTQTQRERIIAVLCAGDPAPEPTPAP